MDVHPTKNGINRYWSIAMLTWHHHFQSPSSHLGTEPIPAGAQWRSVLGPQLSSDLFFKTLTARRQLIHGKKKVPDPGKSRLHDDRTWTTTDKQHFYSGWIASKSKDDIWYILRPFKPKWISMYSVNGCKWPIYMPIWILYLVCCPLYYYTIVSEIQLQWVCNYKV